MSPQSRLTSHSFWRRLTTACLAVACLVSFGTLVPWTAHAATSMFVTAPGSIQVGDTVSINILTNTGSDNANTWDATIGYPTNLFDFVRGTRGPICSIYISEPGSGGGELSCGKPSGYTGSGTLYTLVLTAKAEGSGSITLSGCDVLANDGSGTDITGGCSGTSVTVAPAAQTTTVVTTTPTPTPKSTPKPTPTPTPTPKNTGTPKPAETPQNVAPTPTPTPPPVQTLPSSTPTPTPVKASTASSTPTPEPQGHRTIGMAFADLFGQLKDFKNIPKDTTGAVALSLTMLPLMAMFLAAVFFIYRLYLLERRRRRTLDRLFEMELAELSALEGKMDLLSEKGEKGRDQYKDEFKKAKESILRQIRPDFNKPVNPTPAATAEEAKSAGS